MAIKIQGSIIIDDSKNIIDNTGFFSDANNSGLRPKSSSGGSYFQRWNGSSWETILYGANDGINCYRNVSVAAPYRFIGDGSGLTNLPIPTFTFPYNYYYDATNTAVRANGTTFIQNGAGNDSFAYFNNAEIGLQRNTSVSGNLSATGNISATGRSTSSTHYSDDSNTALRAWGGIYLQNGNGSATHLYTDSSNFQLYRQPYFYSIMGGGSTAEPNLKLGPGGGLKIISSTRRVKENIQYTDLEHICEKIYDLKPVYFNYIGNDTTDIELGLLAEEVNELTPELVWFSYYDDQYDKVLDEKTGNVEKILKEDAVKTPMSITYDKIPLVMIGTFKKLRKRVIDLEEEVQSLKASLQTP